ncbi:DoxX-like family protein [Virgibacillus sp. DJP39]|uniref:DoxX-like family protein n=1 Tax=Virgibacillus sp. DJP39 TaxID=3409790 RepID=UPI003BB7981A
MKHKPIYVEIPINTEMDKIWEATQTPDMHQQWDLRFSSITYLPKIDNEPQKFTYKTKIGFGVQIEGWGESVGSHHAKDGSKTSSLHFGTDQTISIIREGRGYWKYIPNQNEPITFLTQYNYDPSFGKFGSIVDNLIFRPMIGWGTALSFDVLKRWLEKDEKPHSQYIRFFSNSLITFLFFFVWVYHGLVPKLLAMHPEELSMITSVLPLSISDSTFIVSIVGILEVLFGIFWLIYPNKYRLYQLQIILFPLLTLGAVLADQNYLTHPFNPLTFNISLLALSVVGLLNSKDMPTAKTCKRKR